MTEDGKMPFCYVAERDGKWVGVGSVENKAEMRRFYRDFAGDKILPMQTREDWDSYYEEHDMWRRP